MHTIGPYSFTETDVARTFGNLGPWWHLLTTGIDADMITVRGHQIPEALATALEEQRVGGDPLEDELAHLGNRAQRHLGRLDPAIAQLSVSGGGGVPKRPVERVAVSWKGLGGDRQKFRVHHGRP